MAEALEQKSKYIRKKCEHKKYKYLCSICGGSGLCEHGIRKCFCKVCDGSSYCEHDIIKSRCKECKGGSICPHNKRRTRCTECNGGSICIHKKLRSRCAECGGNDLCIHKIRKDRCIECKLSKSICEHNLRKSRCADCNGTEICLHGNNKYCCVECDSKHICIHKKLKSQCADCKGSKICEHQKRKETCIICTPSSACQHCKAISIIGSRFKPYCFRCYCVLHPDISLPRQYKLKEHYVRDALKEEYKETITIIFDKPVQDGCSKYRPDIFMDFGTHCIVIEIDERRHVNYSCEEKRMITLYEDIGFRKIVFLRFNPDGYKVGTNTFCSPFGYTPTGLIKIDNAEMSRRIAELVIQINENRPEPVEQITINYLFYGDI